MGVHMIDPVNNVLQRIMPKVQVVAVKHEWIEDTRVDVETSLAATISTTDGTTMTVASGDGATHFGNCGSGTREDKYLVMIDTEYVSADSRSGDVITITRGFNSSTAATHASAAKVKILGPILEEGADTNKAISVVRTRPYNVVQTYRVPIEVTGVQEAVRKLGGITSEMDYQTGVKAMGDASERLEMNLLWGTRRTGAASTPGLMNGLYNMITTNKNLATSGTVGTDEIEADIRSIWRAGAVPEMILADGQICQDISNLYSDRIRSDVQVNLGGSAVTAVIDVLGAGPVVVIPHRRLTGEYFMLTRAGLGLGYLRPFFLKDIADSGDADLREIIGDYTVELHNEAQHAYRSFDGY
jgi:hypothetical protein